MPTFETGTFDAPAIWASALINGDLTSFDDAMATYSIISIREAIIEVTYPNGRFGIERVKAPRNGSIYEAAYSAASAKASIHGFRLSRFSREEP